MAMGKIEKICATMIMLGAEDVKFETRINDDGEKQSLIVFSSKAWEEHGLSGKFSLVVPLRGKRDLTNRCLNAWLYLFSRNYEAKTMYDTWAIRVADQYVKNAQVGECDLNRVYNNLLKARRGTATTKELQKQESVARKVYELLPKRDAKKSQASSLACFVIDTAQEAKELSNPEVSRTIN